MSTCTKKCPECGSKLISVQRYYDADVIECYCFYCDHEWEC